MGSLTTARIEDLLIAVASPDRHEDSAERKAAWDEIKRRDALLACAKEAADRVVDVHKRLIHAVTPGHAGWISARGPRSTPEGNEEYDALFSEWHAASRQLRDALGRSGEYA